MSNAIKKFKKNMKENISAINCHYCGCDFEENNKYIFPTVDHVVPLARKGKNNKSNFVIACNRCNNLKKAHSYSFFKINCTSVEDRDRKNWREINSNWFIFNLLITLKLNNISISDLEHIR